jgi:hypothetical protein
MPALLLIAQPKTCDSTAETNVVENPYAMHARPIDCQPTLDQPAEKIPELNNPIINTVFSHPIQNLPTGPIAYPYKPELQSSHLLLFPLELVS